MADEEESQLFIPDDGSYVPREGYRPYSPELLPIIKELALLGCSEERISKILNISYETFKYWKKHKPEFYAALHEGRDLADSKVAASLYKRATGFTAKEQHVAIYRGVPVITEVERYYPPDPWSAMKWLQTRQRDTWSESHRLEITNNINIQNFDFLQGMSDDELLMLRNIQLKQIGTKSGEGN